MNTIANGTPTASPDHVATLDDATPPNGWTREAWRVMKASPANQSCCQIYALASELLAALEAHPDDDTEITILKAAGVPIPPYNVNRLGEIARHFGGLHYVVTEVLAAVGDIIPGPVYDQPFAGSSLIVMPTKRFGKVITAITNAIRLLGADGCIQAAIGSWRDGQDEAETVERINEWITHERGRIAAADALAIAVEQVAS